MRLFFLASVCLTFEWAGSSDTCGNTAILPSSGPTVCLPLDLYINDTKGEKGEMGDAGPKGDVGPEGPKGQKGELGQAPVINEWLLLNESCTCSCLYGRNSQAQSGIYDVILSNSTRTIRVYCDMDTDGGGWTVFQRRQDGSVDFYREWNDYKRGFGNLYVEFWLGFDYVHWLLSLSPTGNELRVDLGDAQGNRVHVTYANFSVGDESAKYVLGVSGFNNNSGIIGDSLFHHNGIKFSTKDQNNGPTPSENCAINHYGAWWYQDYTNTCYGSSLNSGYHRTDPLHAIAWRGWKVEPLKFSEMKFRSK